VTRNRKTARIAEATITATITSPCSCTDQVLTAGKAYPRNEITRSPVATITRTPGHQAQNPAKKPQNGPNALCVHR